jgi:RimJ/RimL family protein N-acetyltransferase
MPAASDGTAPEGASAGPGAHAGDGEGGRLTFEPLRQRHAEGLFAALDEPLVGRYIGGPDVTTLAELRARIDRLRAGSGNDAETWLNWVVLLDGTVIGRVEATLHDGIAEVGYVLGPRWWGRGLGSEAVRWLLSALHERAVPEVWASVDPANEASIRLLLRLGFEETEPGAVRVLSYVPRDRVFVARPGRP